MKTLYMEGLDSDAFEELCEEIFSKYYRSKVRRHFLFEDSNTDFVILSKNEIAVECKHPVKTSVGRPAVEKFATAMKKKKVKEGIIVTSGRFASTAQKYIDENNLPITLVDIERLEAIAHKAGIKLVTKKEEPEAFTIIRNSDREFREHLAKRLSQSLQCSENIGVGMTIIERKTSLVPFYRIDYRVDAEFKASNKTIHKEEGTGYFYVNAKTGNVQTEEFAKIYDLAPRMAYTPPPKDDVTKPKSGVLNSFYDRVQRDHTKYVPYMTKSNKLTTKTCSPAKKDITIQNMMCLYLPFSEVDYELFGKEREIKVLESSSDDFIVFEPKQFTCDICSGKISKDGFVCVKCGNVVDDKHGFPCTKCGKTICADCAFFVSKFLGKKDPICGSCANQESGNKIKKFR